MSLEDKFKDVKVIKQADLSLNEAGLAIDCCLKPPLDLDGKVYDRVNKKWVYNHPKLPIPPKRIEAKVYRWSNTCFSVSAEIRTGSFETGNHKTAELSKRAFRSMCNRIGVSFSNQFYYENKIYVR